MENLKEKTLEQLQALAYQNLVNIQAFQRGLEVIEKEIAERQQEKLPTPKEKQSE